MSMISRQKLIEELENRFLVDDELTWNEAMYFAIDLIKSQPPAVGIDRQKLIEELSKLPVKPCEDGNFVGLGAVLHTINSQPPADQWIPVTYRETTEEERECGIEWKYILDCPLPDNDTEILVCTKAGSVWTDTFFNDDGCYLDGGYDLTEIAAWMPLPEPYKGVE